jgi:hypothetical protein
MYKSAYQNKGSSWFKKPAIKSITDKAAGLLKFTRYLGPDDTAE